MLRSGLAEYEEVTVCARFLTYQFNSPSAAEYSYQSVISLSDIWLLGSYTALPCDEEYGGCTEYHKGIIKDWTQGSAFGYFEGNNFYRAWEPGRWNTFCLTASSPLKQTRVFINGKLVVKLNSYEADHKKSEGKNIRLLNNEELTNPSHGAITTPVSLV